MSQTFHLSTTRDRDTGVVLVFLGLVAHFAIPPLAYQFGLSYGKTALVTAPLGTLLMIVGFVLMFLSRKTVTVEPGVVIVKDGFLHRPLHLRYEHTPTIKLSYYEEIHSSGRADEIWTVHLVDDGRQYLIDRRIGQHTACRSLAERITKATQGSFMEVADNQTQKYELSELDLSFVERVAKYPNLLGPPVEEPADKVVHYKRTPEGIDVNWSFFRSGLFFEVLMIAAFLVLVAFIPLPGGARGQGFSLYEAEKAYDDYRYFSGVAAFTVIALALLAGYRNRIRLNPKVGAFSQTTVWGIPVRSGKIPLHQLEHIGITINSRGPYLQLISDKRILKEQLPSSVIARWLAYDMRQYLAGLSPEEYAKSS